MWPPSPRRIGAIDDRPQRRRPRRHRARRGRRGRRLRRRLAGRPAPCCLAPVLVDGRDRAPRRRLDAGVRATRAGALHGAHGPAPPRHHRRRPVAGARPAAAHGDGCRMDAGDGARAGGSARRGTGPVRCSVRRCSSSCCSPPTSRRCTTGPSTTVCCTRPSTPPTCSAPCAMWAAVLGVGRSAAVARIGSRVRRDRRRCPAGHDPAVRDGAADPDLRGPPRLRAWRSTTNVPRRRSCGSRAC